MKKKPGLLWGTLALVVMIGIVVIAPNFHELLQDGTIAIYVLVLIGTVLAIIYTLSQE